MISRTKLLLPTADTNLESTKYWIIVVSKDHVLMGVQGNFAQACRGKASPLKRMKVGDWVVHYSPKLEFRVNKKCQAFTAIGKVTGDMVYPFKMDNGFIPFRRDVEFLTCTEVSILPLIPNLTFIQDKRNWGYIFRLGLFEIQKNDFDLISSQMLPRQC